MVDSEHGNGLSPMPVILFGVYFTMLSNWFSGISMTLRDGRESYRAQSVLANQTSKALDNTP